MDPVILTGFVLVVVGLIFTVMFVFRSRRENIDQIVENIEPRVYEPLPERAFYKGTLSTERVPPREPPSSPLRNYKTKKANIVDATPAEVNTGYSSTTSSMDGLLVGAVAGAILTQPAYGGDIYSSPVDTAPASEPVSTYSPLSADTSPSYDSNPSGSYDSGSSSSYDSSSSSNSDSGGGGW